MQLKSFLAPQVAEAVQRSIQSADNADGLVGEERPVTTLAIHLLFHFFSFFSFFFLYRVTQEDADGELNHSLWLRSTVLSDLC